MDLPWSTCAMMEKFLMWEGGKSSTEWPPARKPRGGASPWGASLSGALASVLVQRAGCGGWRQLHAGSTGHAQARLADDTTGESARSHAPADLIRPCIPRAGAIEDAERLKPSPT